MNIFPVFFAAAKIGIGRGSFYFATTKIRIGRGALLRLVGCGRDRCHSGGFLLRIMPPLWHPVPACAPRLRCRRAVLFAGNGLTQAELFYLRQRKLELDAERCCGRGRRHSGGFLLRIMPPSWHPVPACAPRRLCCRRAILLCDDGLTQAELFYLRQRKLELDASS